MIVFTKQNKIKSQNERYSDKKKYTKNKEYKSFTQTWELYVITFMPVILFIIFKYIPIGGNIIAFEDYSIRKGLLGSPFVGLKYFKRFFELPISWQIIRNTLILNTYQLLAGFPFPIILALAFNELGGQKAKKSLQTITYAPYFISTVVLVGILMQAFSYRFGVVNSILKIFGVPPQDFMGNPAFFRPAYVLSGIWQGAGYSSILYIAALSTVDPSLYEAAIIDGATRLQRVCHIDIPCILPTIVITLILNTGGLLNIGFEKVYLMQNPMNYPVSEIISTYVYKVGIQQTQFSFSTAIGLFNAVVNFILLMTVNRIARVLSGTGLI
jgi:putative aldouronate transport system permease protein